MICLLQHKFTDEQKSFNTNLIETYKYNKHIYAISISLNFISIFLIFENLDASKKFRKFASIFFFILVFDN